MTSATARRAGPRLRRGSLTPEVIVTESLRLLDAEGLEGFSLPKLGRSLGADPTAVYRHFASKDDLVLAIADKLIDEAMDGLSPQDCWVETISQGIRRLRATYCAHPAAASLSACRTTQRPAEMRSVDTLIGAVMRAGFKGAQAALMYRVIGDFALAWSGGEADFLALEPSQQSADRAAWTRAYLAVDRTRHPNIWQLRDELAEVTDQDIFETILSVVIEGLCAKAPVPCTCPAHGGPAKAAPATVIPAQATPARAIPPQAEDAR